MIKVNVIVALYYPHYYQRVRTEIVSFLQGFDCFIVFVDNNGTIKPNIESNENITWIMGSNIGGEFSAWDEGYNLLVNIRKPADDEIVIFINDTFCHHHLFTYFDRHLYRKTISACKDNSIYGDVNSIGEFFSIYERCFSSWISSYFFLGKKKNIDKLLPLNKQGYMGAEYMRHINNALTSNRVDVPIFSDKLNQHLTDWLFPVNSKGWYGARNVSQQLILFKLNAIINEKLLTYNIVENELSLANIYHGTMKKLYNSMRNKLYFFCKNNKLIG
ncbi:hypothetical protein JEM57_18465 [Escherichia albertii]|uniref:hypothetical protein n=1 Tax=Escherichia albertii TaxID=208962 RepID=UPI001F2B4D36|nr:hypothetical protein [Escherichia albertii]EEX2836894.1 hypothetical protein [Escherichia albertii]MCE7722636.1 hypothetical protein [Escherichia albertii]MCE7726884.1 hypothetical protein [Escherichia albertii]MCZ8779458.1 hypothetical protein [Escherichia albertii]